MIIVLQHKVWLKAAGEQAFVYGNNVLKSHLARITDGTPVNAGVVIYNMQDVPLVRFRQYSFWQ